MSTSTLKILRELNDYTQEYIAEDVLGVSKTTYSRLEHDPSNISAMQAQKLAELYNISLVDLLSNAAPIITFRDSLKENHNGTAGYQHSNINNFNEGEVKVLREQNELLIRQNSDLMELVKVLGGKLGASSEK